MLYSKPMPGLLRALYLGITDLSDSLKDSWVLVAQKKPGWQPRTALPRKEWDEVLGRSTTYHY